MLTQLNERSQTYPIHQSIGKFIRDAKDTQSELSLYFARLKKNAFAKENDRIRFSLFGAMELALLQAQAEKDNQETLFDVNLKLTT
jgi:hypothetical protein